MTGAREPGPDIEPGDERGMGPGAAADPTPPPEDDPHARTVEDPPAATLTAPTRTAATAPPLHAPGSPAEIFLAFTRLSMQGFGGVLPVAQRELVERLGWLTREQFVEMLAVSQVLPGPNVVNLSLMFGDGHFGLRGAFAALGGMLLVPMVVVLVLTVLYGNFAEVPAVSGALRGMGAVAAGLIIATGFKLLGSLRRSALGPGTGLGLAAAMALGSGWLHWPLLWLLTGLGALACLLAWRRLRP